jgi:hypothetical protein
MPRHHDLIDQAVCFRLVWRQKAVACDLFSNFGFGLARMAYDGIVADLSQTQHHTRVHVYLGRLALDTSKRFMDPDGSMRQRKTLAGCSCRQQEGTGARCRVSRHPTSRGSLPMLPRKRYRRT